MPLVAGTLLGPYEILSPIGAGGMGEVYLARDPRLDRDVAVKVSAAQFSERFEREARAVAALNHPNICTLYDIGPNYLVMELVEGLTLKERLAAGAIPLEEAIGIAAQITYALEAAHDKSIVHRDLKPANVKIRPDGTVKVLDFGLAKTGSRTAASAGDPVDSPTLSLTMTEAGVILGTAGYMSPEQARGEPVDKRADIWAFGVVLYEMLTARRMFDGKTVSDTLAAVLIKEPDLEQVPARARPVLRRCLAKDPKTRLHHAADARLMLLEEAHAEAAQALAPSRPKVSNAAAWTGAALATVALAALAFVHFREKPPVAEPVRFQIPAPEKAAFINSPPGVSPDGRKLAFVAADRDGRPPQLWVRSLDTLEARPLSGTENANANTFAWSPDSRSIAFVQGNRLRKVDVAGGPPQTVCDLPTNGGYRGGGWSPSGAIVFGVAGAGLWRVSEAGGAPSPLTKLDPSRQEGFHAIPSFLPDRQHFIYYRSSAVGENQGAYLGSLDAKPEQQSTNRLLATAGIAVYAPSPDQETGHLLFLREGSLMAQPFDARRLELAGEAVPIAEGIGNNFQNSWLSASTTGVLAYRTGAGGAATPTQLTWFDRAGKNLGAVWEQGVYTGLALSPDGTRAAVQRVDTQGTAAGGAGNSDIWTHEFARNTPTRLTFDPANDGWPVWSPDGTRIAFVSGREASANLYQKVSSGAGDDEVLLKSFETKYLQDWSRDGRFLMYSQAQGGNVDLWVLPLEGDKKPVPYLKTEFFESEGRFSPDGRFVVYSSNASGSTEIYVQPFPVSTGGKWQISKGGGLHPRWRRDGKELFYISADSKMMAVEVSTTPEFKVLAPKVLFPVAIFGGGASNAGQINATRYDVTADGQRFLVSALATEAGGVATQSSPITVVLNWQAGLRK